MGNKQNRQRAHSDRAERREFQEKIEALNKEQFLANARAAMADETPLPVNIEIRDAWVLVSALQLAARHPSMPRETRNHIVSLAHQFQGAVTAVHPEAEVSFKIGWDAHFNLIK